MDTLEGYQLTFDPKRKQYATENCKYIIRPPLSNALRKEILSVSQAAITTFVLKTDHPAMYVLQCYYSLLPVEFYFGMTEARIAVHRVIY